jgi:hypothetical protein
MYTQDRALLACSRKFYAHAQRLLLQCTTLDGYLLHRTCSRCVRIEGLQGLVSNKRSINSLI